MQTIQKKIEVNYRPLQTSGGIEAVGSVPDVQVYQADKAEYTPDYTLTPDAVPPVQCHRPGCGGQGGCGQRVIGQHEVVRALERCADIGLHLPTRAMSLPRPEPRRVRYK